MSQFDSISILLALGDHSFFCSHQSMEVLTFLVNDLIDEMALVLYLTLWVLKEYLEVYYWHFLKGFSSHSKQGSSQVVDFLYVLQVEQNRPDCSFYLDAYSFFANHHILMAQRLDHLQDHHTFLQNHLYIFELWLLTVSFFHSFKYGQHHFHSSTQPFLHHTKPWSLFFPQSASSQNTWTLFHCQWVQDHNWLLGANPYLAISNFWAV